MRPDRNYATRRLAAAADALFELTKKPGLMVGPEAGRAVAGIAAVYDQAAKSEGGKHGVREKDR